MVAHLPVHAYRRPALFDQAMHFFDGERLSRRSWQDLLRADYIGQQAREIGEAVIVEMNQSPLRPNVQLRYLRFAAIELDGDDLEQIVRLLREFPEAVDQLGSEGFDLLGSLELVHPPVKAHPKI
jgi:hypothetical protein